MSQPAKKTAQERAQDAVDRKDRKIARLTDRAATLRADLAEVEHEIMLAKREREYLAAHPALLDDDPAQTTIDDTLGDETLPASGDL